MATNSPLQGVPLPEVTDADNVPYDLGNAVSFIEGRLVMRFSSAADRDAKVTAPAPGMFAYLGDVAVWTAYTSAGWATVADPAWVGAWKTYTPSVAGMTGYVAGNDTRTGRYRITGKTMDFYASWTIGSTTTIGTSGSIGLDMPSQINPRIGQLFSAFLIDTSLNQRYTGTGWLASADWRGTSQRIHFAPNQLPLTQTNPITLAAGDSLTIQGTVELV